MVNLDMLLVARLDLQARANAATAATNQDPTSGLQDIALAILFALPSLALITVVIRSSVRWSLRQFALDDWLICAAMLISIGETFISYKGTFPAPKPDQDLHAVVIKTSFIGIPGRDIPPNHDFTESMIWEYAVTILYNPILGLVKASVLIFLLRLFGQKDGVRPYCLILNTVNILHMIGALFALIFQCFPIEANWMPNLGGARCVDKRILYTTTSSITLLTDLLVLALPIYIFSGLKIPRKTKIALLFVFLLGGL
jgi:hypothetical protein